MSRWLRSFEPSSAQPDECDSQAAFEASQLLLAGIGVEVPVDGLLPAGELEALLGLLLLVMARVDWQVKKKEERVQMSSKGVYYACCASPVTQVASDSRSLQSQAVESKCLILQPGSHAGPPEIAQDQIDIPHLRKVSSR